MRRWDVGLPLRALAELGPAARAVMAGTRLERGEGPADAIVVLGATVLPGGEPSGSLRARALAAAELYHAGGAPLVVTTGAHHAGPPGEAVVARRLLIEAGVPEAVIRIEEKSRNTRGNLTFARPLVEGARAWIVTEPFHMARALVLAREVGFEPLPWPVISPAWGRPLDRWRLVARDVVSMAVVRAGG